MQIESKQKQTALSFDEVSSIDYSLESSDGSSNSLENKPTKGFINVKGDVNLNELVTSISQEFYSTKPKFYPEEMEFHNANDNQQNEKSHKEQQQWEFIGRQVLNGFNAKKPTVNEVNLRLSMFLNELEGDEENTQVDEAQVNEMEREQRMMVFEQELNSIKSDEDNAIFTPELINHIPHEILTSPFFKNYVLRAKRMYDNGQINLQSNPLINKPNEKKDQKKSLKLVQKKTVSKSRTAALQLPLQMPQINESPAAINNNLLTLSNNTKSKIQTTSVTRRRNSTASLSFHSKTSSATTFKRRTLKNNNIKGNYYHINGINTLAPQKIYILPSSKVQAPQFNKQGKKFVKYIQKLDPNNYNEINDKNMTKDANDKHKNLLLKISEMMSEMDIFDYKNLI